MKFSGRMREHFASGFFSLNLCMGLAVAPWSMSVAAREVTPSTESPAAGFLDIEELMAVRIKIASIENKPSREQPAIVSVIGEKEIHETGARDLMDVLSLVPGFSFGEDVDSVAGAGFRGLWAYEGKILVLLDGVPINEGLYGTVPLGSHFPAGQMKQVEILRGPGSARYGGHAELCVISITSKGAEQNGGFVTVRPEVVSDRVGVKVDSSIGCELTNDWRFSVGASYENFIRSDQKFVAQNGAVVDMQERSDMFPYLINASLGWKELDLRFIYDNYQFDNPIGFGNPLQQTTPWGETFRSLRAALKYDVKPVDWLTVSPKAGYTREHPWWLQTSPGQGDFKLQYEKWNVDLPAEIHFKEHGHLLLGVAAFTERTTAKETSPYFGQPPPATFFMGHDDVDYDDIAGYAQFDLDTAWANFSVGGRYESHSYAGSAWVPRLAIVKAWERLHLKALYDQAFRTPNVESIQQRLGSQRIDYEKTTSYQLEAGYRFDDHFSTVANLYYLRVEQPLAFTTIDNLHFGYLNGSPVSSYGGECQLRYACNAFSGSLGYSYYQADEKLSGTTLYLYGSSVGGLNLALPAHKVSFSGTYHFTPRFDWNWNGTYSTACRAWTFPGTERWLAPEFNLNTFVEYRWKAMSLGAGVRNLLDEDLQLGQAYNGGSAPLPLLRRNYFITLSWRF